MSRWIGTLAYATLVACIVAALTHLAVVLGLPYRKEAGAWSRVAAATRGATLETTSGFAAAARLPYRDPAMADAACLYDLRSGPVSASLDASGTAFATLSVHGRQGRVLYGLTSRSATRDRLTLVILTTAQAARRPARPSTGGMPDIQVVTDEPDGFVDAAVLARTPSEAPSAARAADGLICRSLPSP